MKLLKVSSIVLLTCVFMWLFIPEASAKHHHRRHYRFTSFGLGLNLNLNPPTRYYNVGYVQPVYYPAPAPVYSTTYVVQQPVAYPYYTPGVVVEQPYYPYWGY